MTFQGQGHVISRSMLLILVTYVRMHLFAKFYANRTIRLPVIQMAPNVTYKSNRQLQSGHHNTTRKRHFAVKKITVTVNKCRLAPSLRKYKHKVINYNAGTRIPSRHKR